jgi:hypothetical protein
MLTLAYLLQTSLPWRGASLRVKMVVRSRDAAQPARANLERIVRGLRSGAEAEVIVGEGRRFVDILRVSSAGADMVILGMAEPSGDFRAYYERMRAAVEGMPTTAFVLAAEDLPFKEILFKPDSGAGA